MKAVWDTVEMPLDILHRSPQHMAALEISAIPGSHSFCILGPVKVFSRSVQKDSAGLF